MKSRRRRPFARHVKLAAACTAALTAGARAGTVSWKTSVTLGDWGVSGNWVQNTVPTTGDDVQLFSTDGADHTARYVVPANSNVALNTLKVDSSGDGDFTLQITQNSLHVVGDLSIGVNVATLSHDGAGQVEQSGGAILVDGNLRMGTATNARARYALSGTSTLSVGGDFRLGEAGGRGDVTHFGGTNTVAGTLQLGSTNAGSIGTYRLADTADLRAGTVRVSAGSFFTMTGGRLGGTGDLFDTRTVFNDGTFIYSGGQFDAKMVNTGTLTITATYAEFYRGLTHASAQQTLNIPANLVLNAYFDGFRVESAVTSSGTVSASSLIVGNTSTGVAGSFTQNAGVVAGSGSASSLNLDKGSYALVNGTMVFPRFYVNAGSFTQSSGTVNAGVIGLGSPAGSIVQNGGVFNVIPTAASGTDSNIYGGTLTLNGAVNWGASARVSILGGATATFGGVQSWHPTASLTVNHPFATLNLASDMAGTGAANLNLTLLNGVVNVNATQHLASFGATNVGIVTMAASPSAGGKVLVTKSLALGGTAKLNLTNNAIVVDYPAAGPSPLAGIRSAIVSGYGPAAANHWTGAGIQSSTAAADSTKAVGYALASEVLTFGAGGTATFFGQTVDPSSVLVRYTLAGDATLDGAVDFNDLVKLAQNYNATVSTAGDSWWVRGDFNYDGMVDFNDLVKLAQNYNKPLAGGGVPALGAAFDAEVARAFAAVPEPSLALLAAPFLAGIGCRRRRGR